MSHLVNLAVIQLMCAYLWYPVAYRLSARLQIGDATSAMYEHHRGYGFLLALAVAYLVPGGPSPAYWVIVGVFVPMAAAGCAAVLARVRQFEFKPAPVFSSPPSPASPPAKAVPSLAKGRSRPKSRRGPGRARMKASTTR